MSKKKFSVKALWPLLKESFSGFSEDKVPKLSASLAYYTVFALGPLMVLIITICALVMKTDAINNTIYTQMKGFVGSSAADQMQEIVKNASLSGKSTMAAIIGGITLLVGATGVFGEIQDSINSIWGLKPKPKAGIMKLIKNRLLSFGIIGTLGFLLLVSLAATAVVETIGDRLQARFPDVTVVVFYVINLLLTLGVTTVLFAVIFKVLPDAKIKWKDVWIGAIFTSVMFLIGKFLISLYISKADVGGTYGTAGSLVIILVWIYYSAMILYLGAEFTKAYVMKFADALHPNHYAVTVQKMEVEKGGKSVQQVAKEAPKDEAVVQGKAQPKKEPVYQPIKPELAYVKGGEPEKGTHLSAIPALAVGLIAFVSHLVKSNRTQA